MNTILCCSLYKIKKQNGRKHSFIFFCRRRENYILLKLKILFSERMKKEKRQSLFSADRRSQVAQKVTLPSRIMRYSVHKIITRFSRNDLLANWRKNISVFFIIYFL